MTIIACKEMNGIIEIASDSCAVYGGQVSLSNKLTMVGGTIFGTAGYSRDRDLFEHFLRENPIKKPSKKQTTKSVVYSHLIKFLDFYGKYHPIKEFHHSNFILIFGGDVFVIIGTALDKIEPGTPAAIGSGSAYALSSMSNGRAPMLAVKDSCLLDVNCRPPIHKMTVDKASGEIKYFKHDFSL